MGALSVRTIISGGLMMLVAAGFAQAQMPQRPPVGGIGSPPDAMIFYVARGAADSCGKGCSEWIAAEGTVQWDTYKRLLAILDRQAGRKLPVIIHSWGESNLNVAVSLGWILRDRGMDTTVGTTEVEACSGKTEAECFALKRPGGPLDAKMNLPDARCELACVLMLARGIHRSLPPGTKMILTGMFIRNRLAPNVSDERRRPDCTIWRTVPHVSAGHGRCAGAARYRRQEFRIPASNRNAALRMGSVADRHRLGAVTRTAPYALQQPQIAQFAPQWLGHRRDAGAHGTEIRWHIAIGEIAPALEGPHRPRHHGDHLGLHDQTASSDAIAIAEGLDRNDLFTRRDFTADHPV
ncbi:hypothetical protein SAMN05444158_0806 [Bradyrhizobium canariense]|uniref:Uncharacterized protein n=1 Tax=Bradyrhizobium canariense TaxID=255045 RepID=A0A1H1NYP1_9BRAD|nr:hypothetical protein SAMN05444158_0806 [Bradyrhizobium canariense]